jgi:GH15 family glucan-1,4-alpha-glucosidase
MPLRIEDYALIGDTQTAALVGLNGSIDWLCVPRFDSDACFATLLGDERHGRWLLAPAGGVRAVRRRYRPGTLVLETTFETEDGTLVLTDCMPPRQSDLDIVRVLRCTKGRVPIAMELAARFGYGAILPWIGERAGATIIVAGPDALALRTGVPLTRHRSTLHAEFALAEGESTAFTLTWYASFRDVPAAIDPEPAVEDTDAWWREWSANYAYNGEWREDVLRSLITLKALTYLPTGGIMAAATTSLPEKIGGVRNWDYRYCWLRDATFTLYALMLAGFKEEAQAWRDWLVRAVAGDAAQMQIMYGPAGERRLPELELGWLPGYEGSAPVRVGNAAVAQFQLDVYGEVMDCLHQARRVGIQPNGDDWGLQKQLMEFLESHWNEPDEGIWEVRGPRRHFTHSKVMAWVALDRAITAVEQFGLDGPADRWTALRAEIHEQVCRLGYDPLRNVFTQYYGSKTLDAALLLIPLVGFLPPEDPRVRGTVEAIERELCRDGFILRYPTHETIDGLPPGEGVFLPCTFWLADTYMLLGRHADARGLFERLLALRNDVGLLSEQYDPIARRLVGNFPQAFTHVALVNTARNLSRAGGPAEHRPAG